MQQAWEYEKEGMGLQYNYGQQAADAEYKRNLQMWKDTNVGAQRAEMEDAGLSVGLMYGNGGGQAASTAGGNATQPNSPKTNPVEVALQQQALEILLCFYHSFISLFIGFIINIIGKFVFNPNVLTLR